MPALGTKRTWPVHRTCPLFTQTDIPQRIIANTCTSTSPGYRRPALGLDPSGYDGVSPRARNVN